MTTLSESIPWESFRPLPEQGYAPERKSKAERTRIAPLILVKMLVLQQLFNLSDEDLEFQIIDRRSFEEFFRLGVMNSIKEGKLPGGLEDKLNRLCQKDLDARWVKKNDTIHYGYKNSICIDVTHGFIRRYAVTPANIHDSQMLTPILAPENRDDFVCVDSGYAGVKFEELL